MPRLPAIRKRATTRKADTATSSRKRNRNKHNMVLEPVQVKNAWRRTFRKAPVELLRKPLGKTAKWTRSITLWDINAQRPSPMPITSMTSFVKDMSKLFLRNSVMRTRSGAIVMKGRMEREHLISRRRMARGLNLPPGSYQPPSSEDNLFPGTTISHAAAARAARVDPNEGRCMVTGRTDNVRPIYVVPCDTPEGQVVTLEKAWGYDRKSLHVEGRHNIIFLHDSLYDAFEAHEWMLLPDSGVTRTLYKHCQNHLDRKPSNICNLYQSGGKAPSFTYYAVPTVHSKHPELFEGLGPLKSHLYPHFAILRGAQTKSRAAYGQNEDLIVQLLVKSAGMRVNQVLATLGNMAILRRHWLANEKWYTHRSAPQWTSHRSNSDDGDESIRGLHKPSPDSTCGWFSDMVTNSADDVERPRPHLGIPPADPYQRVQDWVNDSRKYQERGSHNVLQATEARFRLHDAALTSFADLPVPSWLDHVNWTSHLGLLPRSLTADEQSDGDSDWEDNRDSEEHGRWDYAAFSSMDWAFHLTKCKLWLSTA